MGRIAIFLIILLTGCAGGVDLANLPPIPSGDTRIIVERRFALLGSGQYVSVEVDGQKVLSVGNGSNEFVDVPGDISCFGDNHKWHEVTAHTWLSMGYARVCFQAGQTMTFLTGYNWTGGMPMGVAWVPTGTFGFVQK